MKKIVMILTLVLVVTMLVPTAAALAVELQEICLDNVPPSVTGGTEHGFCSDTPGEEDEWHFVITSLNPVVNAPASITAEFQNAGSVVIPWEKTTGSTAHYRLEGVYLDDTLLNACANITVGTQYGQFNLSHAPCDDNGGSSGGNGQHEVGGTVYPPNKAALLAPWIALAVVTLAATVILVRRIRIQS